MEIVGKRIEAGEWRKKVNLKRGKCTDKYRLGKTLFQLWREAERNIRISAHGNSMYPLIRTGDILTVRLGDAAVLSTGDIFAFWTDHGLVTHRLIRKKKIQGQWQLCQKGDNCTGWSWIHGREVIGKVEVIQGRRTIDMTHWPWLWLNPLLGLIIRLWIILVAAARSLKILFPGHRRMTGISSLWKRLYQMLQKPYYLLQGGILWIGEKME